MCENEGWGEFEMQIDLYYTDKSGKITIPHDLNFQQNRYEDTHVVTFKNPSQSLQQILRETGPLPNDEDRRNRKVDGSAKKQKKPFDVEKMADALVKLEEDDLLQVIQMIHDHKADDTYVQNNLDGMSSKETQGPPSQGPLLYVRNADKRLYRSWRVLCRPLHPARQPWQDDLGLPGEPPHLGPLDNLK